MKNTYLNIQHAIGVCKPTLTWRRRNGETISFETWRSATSAASAAQFKNICLGVTCLVIGHPLYAQEPNPEFIVDCW